MREVKFADVLKQYKIYHFVDDNTEYRQVTISRHTGVSYRGTKFGRDIGRKRQFVIDLEEYPNTFIFTRQGVQDGSYGIVPQDVHNCIVTENMPMFAVQPTLNPAYLEFYLQTKHFQDQLQALNAAGSAQKSIHENTLLQLEILFPDIVVQKAIVEEIESVKNKQEKVLVELQIQSNLIFKLRASILSDAVSGRLVPQKPTDELASMLLERINAEKERLIKDGKLKREKPLSLITADDIPYELPDGWVWCRLSAIAEIGTGATPLKSTASYYNGTIPWVTSSATGERFIEGSEVFITEKALRETNCKIYPTGTLILAMYGQGKTRGQISELCIDAALNQACAALSLYLYEEITKKYLKLFFQKHYFELRELAVGGAQPNLNLQKIKDTLIPLPPLAEQHRIVAKVEKLMATCDALEAEVAKSRMETDRLMQTILKEAFEERNEIDV